MHWWMPEVSIFEKILRSAVVYLFLLVAFRLLGKRQVAQMTPFDLIVLLIISNVLQNAMIGPDNSLTGGLIGATTVLTLNWVIARATMESRKMERLVEGAPTILVHHGHVIEEHLKRELISHEQLLSALRKQGIFSLSDVKVALLEESGALSVLREEQPNSSRGN